MKEKIFKTFTLTILLFVIMLNFASAKGQREADFTWQFSVGQTFESISEVGTEYEILTPNLTHIISQKDGTAEFSLNKAGDVYILAHLPDGKDFLYHLIVGIGNETIVEEKLSTDLNPEEFAQQVLDLVNKERRQRGIAPLRLSSDLLEAAEIRAEEISRVFSHTRPNGKSCHSMFRNGQYTIGENIAAGCPTPKETVKQWMDSSGHRANILNADYKELGVGYYYKSNSEYKYYWVQIFRRPMPKPIIIHR